MNIYKMIERKDRNKGVLRFEGIVNENLNIKHFFN